MAMPQPNPIENPIKLSKFIRNINPADEIKRNKLVSFWAFLFSIIMYISIFYLFNLSPYTLVSTTNFWFFISNTLILIIAADFNFGSFSHHPHEEYLFQEYMKNCQEKSTNSTNSSFNYYSKEIINIPHEEESIKDVVLIEKNKQDEEEGGGGGIINVKNNEVDQEDHEKKKKEEEEKLLGRSNSELKAIIMVETNEKKKKNVVKGIQRSKSERYDLLVNGDEEIKDDEFSDMSVEELNRRVEEFIQRFNRQIRLQAAATNLQI